MNNLKKLILLSGLSFFSIDGCATQRHNATKHSSELENILAKANLHEQKGETEKARAIYQKALQKENGPQLNHFALSVYYYQLGRLTKDPFEKRTYLENAIDYFEYSEQDSLFNKNNSWYHEALNLLVQTYKKLIPFSPQQREILQNKIRKISTLLKQEGTK